jgi:hypothetical protein
MKTEDPVPCGALDIVEMSLSLSLNAEQELSLVEYHWPLVIPER